MATKSKVTVPAVIKVGGSGKNGTAKNPTKKSEITHKSSKEAETLAQVLSKIEDCEDRMSKAA